MPSTDKLKYWVGFSLIPGIGRVKISQIKQFFGNMENAWQASAGELKQAGLDQRSVSTILDLRPKISLDDEITKLEKHNVTALTCDDPLYPPRLREIYDYPVVLYVRGKLLPKDGPYLAVVGTRHPTIYGRQVAEELATELTQSGITIVSGLARGIDSVVHKATLKAGGDTIAVFASGLDVVYPAENVKLAQSIMEHGALVSEYPLGVRPRAGNFPLRNRIMSGLSLGVLVIEAGERSGALITAFQALEQDREVFAVPGSILSPTSKGTNRLIQEGAKLVRNQNDILEELNLTGISHPSEPKEFQPENEIESQVIKQLGTEPHHIDTICRFSGLAMSEVSSTLVILELKGVVKHMGNMNYVLAHNIKAE